MIVNLFDKKCHKIQLYIIENSQELRIINKSSASELYIDLLHRFGFRLDHYEVV